MKWRLYCAIHKQPKKIGGEIMQAINDRNSLMELQWENQFKETLNEVSTKLSKFIEDRILTEISECRHNPFTKNFNSRNAFFRKCLKLEISHIPSRLISRMEKIYNGDEEIPLPYQSWKEIITSQNKNHRKYISEKIQELHLKVIGKIQLPAFCSLSLHRHSIQIHAFNYITKGHIAIKTSQKNEWELNFHQNLEKVAELTAKAIFDNVNQQIEGDQPIKEILWELNISGFRNIFKEYLIKEERNEFVTTFNELYVRSKGSRPCTFNNKFGREKTIAFIVEIQNQLRKVKKDYLNFGYKFQMWEMFAQIEFKSTKALD